MSSDRPGIPTAHQDLRSLVDVLRRQATERGSKVAYTFLEDGDRDERKLTYAELDARARSLAARLSISVSPGERVLLLYPAGLDYIVSFFACLYAGITAVPAYPPLRARGMGRIDAIVKDCRPRLALTHAAIRDRIAEFSDLEPETASLEWLASDELDLAGDVALPELGIGRDDLAFLQYTSGSTGDPKGVMVTHGNLLANQAMISHAFRLHENSCIVGWLPLYHDMGLIGNVFQPLWLGATCVLMSPVHFLQRPRRWLEAISRYGGTCSGGPDFAYDLCARKIDPRALDDLDLSRWEIAFDGAEPVRSATLDRFAEVFAPAGFRRSAFEPCYGLAEATLIVSGGREWADPSVHYLSGVELENNRIASPHVDDDKTRVLIGCGRTLPGETVAIIDPTWHRAVANDQIGEIWIRGEHVARGYWNRSEETERTFGAKRSDTDVGPWLRTGDLGFVRGGEICVAGRLKDLIIIRGRNFYPQDVESTVEASHPSLRPTCSAAFSVETSDGEALVCVQEIDVRKKAQASEALEAIVAAVSTDLDVQPFAVVLVGTGGVPKTSSGKVRRRECRSAFLSGSLEVIAEWRRDHVSAAAANEHDEDDMPIVDWIVRTVAKKLGIQAATIDADRPIIDCGLDSLGALELGHAVEERFGIEVPLARLLEGMSFNAAAEFVAAAPRPRATAVSTSSSERSLTSGERGLWFLQRLEPQSAAYALASAMRVFGPLDIGAMERALAKVVERHAALRTRFVEENGEPRRVVVPESTFEWMLVTEKQSGDDLSETLRRFAFNSYDLARGPLFRALVARIDAEDHVLVVGTHHIVADLWSAALLLDELRQNYEAESNGTPITWSPEAFDMSRRAAEEERFLASPEGLAQRDHWLRELGGEPTILDMPLEFRRPPRRSHRGGSLAFELPRELSIAVEEFSRRHGVTLYTATLAAFQVLLHRFTGQIDILVGSPTSGRGRRDTKNAVGYFVNPVVMRADFDGSPAFASFLEVTKSKVVAALANADFPFSKLVELLDIRRDASRSPLFQAMFAFERARRDIGDVAPFLLGSPGMAVPLGRCEMSAIEFDECVSPFDLTMNLAEADGMLGGTLVWNADVFSESTALSVIEGYEALLEGIVAAPETSVSKLPILSASSRRDYAAEAATFECEFEGPATIHESFEQAAEIAPTEPAIVFGASTTSYVELSTRANKLARHLVSLGARVGVRIGVLVERSTEMVVALLGVLKSNAAYVPLDPEHPHERLRAIVDDANVLLIVTDQVSLERCGDFGRPVVQLGASRAKIDALPASPPPLEATGEDLAYVIYTSGSTGRPKGVQIEHRSVVNLLRSMAHRPGISEDDTLLAVTTITFDIAGLELFLPLITGARVVIADSRTTSDGMRLSRLLETTDATIMQATPATWRMLFDAGWTGKTNLRVLCGGEALPLELARRLSAATQEVWNVYGPTETTIWSMVRRIEPDCDVVTLGEPVDNTEIHILDDAMEPVPSHVPGELWIGGLGLARGYLDRPELEAAAFRKHPFRDDETRLYRTGDLVRRRTDGDIEFLGRRDHQVKIRGFRIELGEIETRLAQHPRVRSAVVVARPFGSELRLVAYLVPTGGPSPTAGEWRSYLEEHLPDYMIPSAFVMLDVFPLTPNGKLDRRALPEPIFESPREANDSAPLSATEEIVAAIWSEVLGVVRPGREGNFFDHGGHSLLAVRLVSRLRDVTGTDLDVRQVFENPTVARLAAAVDGANRVDQTPLTLGAPGSDALLSLGQERLWFIDQLEQGSAFYNIVAAVRLEGAIDAALLERAILTLVERHDVLRSSFAAEDGHPRRSIESGIVIDFSARKLEGGIDAAILAARELASRTFDLSKAPLFSARLFEITPQDQVFVLVVHHIIADGWSLGRLVREAGAVYGAFARGEDCDLSPLPARYGDFAHWQREQLAGPHLRSELDWWKRRLEDAPPHLELPTDRERPMMQTFRGGKVTIDVDADLVARLDTLARRLGATPFMVLLAAWRATLARASGANDIVVGSPMAGRRRVAFEGLVGFFLETVALRGSLDGDPTLEELVRRERETTLQAFAHSDVPFDRIVDELVVERDPSRSPIFQALFTLQVPETLEDELFGARASLLDVDAGVTKFDAMLDLFHTSNGIHGAWIYNVDLFDAATIRRFVADFMVMLAAFAERPEARLSAIDVTTSDVIARLDAHGCPGEGASDERTLLDLVRDQARSSADSVAVRFGDRAWTYAQLDAEALRIAARLRRLDAAPGRIVGVALPRSLELVAALRGILETGAAWVALDPHHPEARIAELAATAGVEIIVTRRDTEGRLPAGAKKVFVDDPESADTAPESGIAARADDLAYVVFTSGSTGKPKGVMCPHRGVVNYMRYLAANFALGPQDVVLQIPAVTFDASVRDIFGTLTSGAQLVLVSEQEVVDARALIEIVETRKVTSILSIVPTHLGALVDAAAFDGRKLTSLRRVVASGEVLHRTLVERLRAVTSETCDVVNQYGPTECTMTTTFHRVPPGPQPVRIPVGRPLDGARVYVLDRHGRRVPPGIFGEVYIGGVGVTKGYIGQPELTAERFVDDPFAARSGSRMYRTGDRARFVDDGTLEFSGRIDNQVKIRGFRVEPGEIEARLEKQEGVRKAAVILRASLRGEPRLLGYVVPTADAKLSADELRTSLKSELPEYMVPAFITILDAIPVTANGKIDRKRLPEPDTESRRTRIQAPESETEKIVAEVWAKVLGDVTIGVHDNFFDLGGHSLSSIEVIAGLRDRLGVRLAPRELMFQTLGQIAALCDERRVAPTTTKGTGRLAGLKEKLKGALKPKPQRDGSGPA